MLRCSRPSSRFWRSGAGLLDEFAAAQRGDDHESIIEVARIRDSSLIVMGSRGLGRLAGLVLGSTSQKVVSHAPCPVLIVR